MTTNKTVAPPEALTFGSQGNPIPVIDTFRTIWAQTGNEATAHGFNGTIAGQRIDFIFAQSNSVIMDASIIYYESGGIYPSDHYPVTANLILHY